ncbi:MAG: chromate transporter [Tidjanibacter sp.]|nr:chromate transporter [Tidjanibacter sp.]
MIYLQLLLSYLKIGFFGFGGGYAMLSLIQNEIVTQRGWLSASEWADIVAISQMTPGPIAINSATYVGYTVTGNVWGSLIATFAVCLPAMTLMLLITHYYLRLRENRLLKDVIATMRPVMVGMIGASALMLLGPETFIDWKSWAIFGICLICCRKKVNPILLIVLSAVAGILLY